MVAQKKSSLPQSIQGLKYEIRLIDLDNFDFENLVFSPVQETQTKMGTQKKIRVYYKHDEESCGPVIFPLREKLSFGVQPNNIDRDGNIIVENGVPKEEPSAYKAPLVLLSKEPKPEEQEEVDFFDGLKETIQKHVVQHREELGVEDDIPDNVLEFNVKNCYYKNKKKDKSPILYSELIYYKTEDKMATKFYGPGDKEEDPRDYKKLFLIEPNIRFEFITIRDGKYTPKFKIYDATVKPLGGGDTNAPPKRLAKKNDMDELTEEEKQTLENQQDELEEKEIVQEVDGSDDGFFDDI